MEQVVLVCEYISVCMSVCEKILIKEQVINFRVRDGNTGRVGERNRDRNFVNRVFM